MSETTNLKLFKHDNPSTNENQFDIEEALNENWDKIDTAYGNLNTNKVDKEEGKGLSTNDFSDEYKEKLDSLENYDDTEIKQDISDIQKKDEQQDTDIENLKSENTELKAENERLRKDIDNNIPTISGSGENITLNETTESRFTKFEVQGNSWQETRSGKNKLKVEDGTITVNGITATVKDGEITLNGTATVDTWISFAPILKNGTSADTSGNPLFEVNSAGKYTMSANEISGTKNNQQYFNITAMKTSGQFSFNLALNNYSVTTDLSPTDQIYGVWILISKDVVLNNYKFNIQIEQGETATEYEQYGAMPSTEFISEIENVGDNVNLYDTEGTNFNNSGKDNFSERMAIGDTTVGQNIYNDYANNIRCRAYYKVLTDEIISISFNNNYIVTYFLEANTSGTIEKTSYSKKTNFVYTATKDTILCLIFSKKDNTEFSNSDVEILKSSIKIEKGDKATTYSKYGQGNANITVCNKNMLNLKENSSVTLKGLTCSIDESGVVTLNGKIQNGYVWFKLTNELKAYESEIPLQNLQEKIGKVNNFTISAKKNSGTSSGSIFPKICLFEKNGARLGWETIENSTIKGTNLEEYTSISIYAGSTETEYNNFKFKVQLEEGQNVTEYIEHQEQNFIFPLQEGQKLRLTDELADDGIHHKRKQKEFDGTENWIKNINYSTETILAVQLQMSDTVVSTSNTLCNYFKYNSDNTTVNTYRFAGNYLLTKLDVSEFPTIEAFKTWLVEKKTAETPVVVEYELAEEEIEPYTEEQQAVYDEIKKTVHSYKDVTNIFSTDETSAIFNVEAKRDIQTQNDNLQSQIDEIKELLSTTATSALLLNNMQSDLESEVE